MNEAAENTTGAAAAPATAPVAKVKDEQNGVSRPKVGTTCARVWEICDKLSAEAKAPAERAKVIAAATAEQINAATVATQHGKWRKYHGLTNQPVDAAAKEAAKAAEKATKEAAAKEAKTKKDAEKAEKKIKAAADKAAKAAAKAAEKATKATPATSGDVIKEPAPVAQ